MIVARGSADDEDAPTDLLTAYIPPDASRQTVVAQLRGAFRHAAALLTVQAARASEARRYRELTDLTQIGVALSNGAQPADAPREDPDAGTAHLR